MGTRSSAGQMNGPRTGKPKLERVGGGGGREGPASDPCLLFPRNPELGTEG